MFRNLVIADKVLLLAENLKDALGRKVNIGLNIGASHSGIEDFLRAGPEFCRFLITNMPRDVLQKVIDKSGNIESFSSMRIL